MFPRLLDSEKVGKFELFSVSFDFLDTADIKKATMNHIITILEFNYHGFYNFNKKLSSPKFSFAELCKTLMQQC